MKLIICLDENKGMLFNNRRQSRDSVLVERVLKISEGKQLVTNSYSAKLFPEGATTVSESPFAFTSKDAFCFAEQKIENLDAVDSVYMFLWNRSYPSDVKFDFDLHKEGFSLVSTEEFVGSSHEKITLESWEKSE